MHQGTITREMPRLSEQELLERIRPHIQKLAYFNQQGYTPHYFQTLFHTANDPETGSLARFRDLAAGRRGGKTKSAAHEVAYYLEFPQQFHADYHGKTGCNDELWSYALTQNYKRLLPAHRAFKRVLKQHGLRIGKDVKELKSEMLFEFKSGSVIEFRSGDEPDSLRGEGLDILWMDEAAFIKTNAPYNVVRSALSDKMGMVVSTTTPDKKNWYWEEFWDGLSLELSSHFRVSYWSIDNPVYPKQEWETLKREMHPMLFAQEHMASFDAMRGIALDPEWLTYYDEDALPKGLDIYIGVDPAISLSENADEFVISSIGLDRVTGITYLLDQYSGRIPFPDQVEKINEWYLRYQPQGLVEIGVENVAYQAALAQQTVRLTDTIPLSGIPAKGKKFERILGMSPMFKAERIQIRKSHKKFIDEWVSYDPALKKPKDDHLDSLEIALRVAGVLLPLPEVKETPGHGVLEPTMSSQDAADRRFRRLAATRGANVADDELLGTLV